MKLNVIAELDEITNIAGKITLFEGTYPNSRQDAMTALKTNTKKRH